MALALPVEASPLFGIASSGGRSLGLVVVVAAVLGLAYLLVHVVDKRIPQLQLLLASGLEYIVLGMMLRLVYGNKPTDFSLSEYISLSFDEGGHWQKIGLTGLEQTLSALGPVVTFGIGAIGLYVGLGTHRSREPKLSSEALKAGAWSAFITFGTTIGVFQVWQFLSSSWLGVQFKYEAGLLVAVLVLAATAAVSGTDVVGQIIRHDHPRRGFMTRHLYNTAWVSELIGIVLFGLVFCIVHVGETSLMREPTIIEWFAINLAVGISLGAIFWLFLRSELSNERLLVSMLGIVVFASGFAYYLNLSAILVNFIAGLVLARSGCGLRLQRSLESLVKPGFIVLYVLLGFSWEPPPLFGWILPGLYVIVRLGGKMLGGYITYYYSEVQEKYSEGFGQGLLAQGGLVAAMALNYQQVYHNSIWTPIVINCLVISVIINEFLGRRAVRRLLVKAGELKFSGATKRPAPTIEWGEESSGSPANEGETADSEEASASQEVM